MSIWNTLNNMLIWLNDIKKPDEQIEQDVQGVHVGELSVWPVTRVFLLKNRVRSPMTPQIELDFGDGK